MRLGMADCEVEVERGALVQVDPLCDFEPGFNSALNVVSLDMPEVKVSRGVI